LVGELSQTLRRQLRKWKLGFSDLDIGKGPAILHQPMIDVHDAAASFWQDDV
jgi:hypothetical protein